MQSNNRVSVALWENNGDAHVMQWPSWLLLWSRKTMSQVFAQFIYLANIEK